jgi:hypothetical protein
MVLVALLAGCSTSPGPIDGGSSGPPAPRPAFAFTNTTTPIDCYFKCYEPSLAVDGAGLLWAADSAQADLAVSGDGGRNWTTVPSPLMLDPAAAAGAIRVEVLLQTAPEGTLFYSAIVATYESLPTPVATSIQVASTKDAGATWTNVALMLPQVPPHPPIFPDRQWLAFGGGQEMYVTFNHVPTGTWISRSTDGGLTWGAWVLALPQGISTSGAPVVDAQGNVLIPACELKNDSMLMYVSMDQGTTFLPRTVGPGCATRPTLAIAPDGVLVAAWSTGTLEDIFVPLAVPHDIYVAISSDGGTTWSAPTTWATNATGTTSPWPLPLPNGSLALAFYRTGQWPEIHVVTGPRDGLPQQDVVLADNIDRDPTQLARTDFANLVRLADGRLATPFSDGANVRVAVQA